MAPPDPRPGAALPLHRHRSPRFRPVGAAARRRLLARGPRAPLRRALRGARPARRDPGGPRLRRADRPALGAGRARPDPRSGGAQLLDVVVRRRSAHAPARALRRQLVRPAAVPLGQRVAAAAHAERVRRPPQADPCDPPPVPGAVPPPLGAGRRAVGAGPRPQRLGRALPGAVAAARRAGRPAGHADLGPARHRVPPVHARTLAPGRAARARRRACRRRPLAARGGAGGGGRRDRRPPERVSRPRRR